jgi:hypothetical protein
MPGNDALSACGRWRQIGSHVGRRPAHQLAASVLTGKSNEPSCRSRLNRRGLGGAACCVNATDSPCEHDDREQGASRRITQPI